MKLLLCRFFSHYVAFAVGIIRMEIAETNGWHPCL